MRLGRDRGLSRRGGQHEGARQPHVRAARDRRGLEGDQAEAAGRLRITQPRLSDLLRGRIDKFSLDALINLAAKAGLAVRVEVIRPAA
jgi:hypothetical protein